MQKTKEVRKNKRHTNLTECHLIIKTIAIIKWWERGKFSQKNEEKKWNTALLIFYRYWGH